MNIQTMSVTKCIYLLFGFLVLPLFAQAASFDCGKAGTKVEKLICADTGLSGLDDRMAKNYADVLKTYPVPDALKLRQKQWLTRRNACEQDEVDESITKCLKESYVQRLQEIDGLARADLPCQELPIIKSESEKAQCLKRWLARHPLELNREHMPVKDQKFCTEFYQALATASPEVRYIEPVLRTEDPQHPGLAKYRQCRDIEPIGLGEDYQGLDDLAHGFRLYRADLDGNPKNGLEEYLYEEESSWSMKNGSTQYVRVKFSADQCYVSDRPNVLAQEPRRWLPANPQYGLSALILFRGRYHIFDLDGWIWLRTITYAPKEQSFSIYQCGWKKLDQLLRNQTQKKE